MITTNNHRAAQSIVDMAHAFVEATTAVSSTEVLLTLLLSEIRKLRLFGRSRSQNEVRWRCGSVQAARSAGSPPGATPATLAALRHVWPFFPSSIGPSSSPGCGRRTAACMSNLVVFLRFLSATLCSKRAEFLRVLSPWSSLTELELDLATTVASATCPTSVSVGSAMPVRAVELVDSIRLVVPGLFRPVPWRGLICVPSCTSSINLSCSAPSPKPFSPPNVGIEFFNFIFVLVVVVVFAIVAAIIAVVLSPNGMTFTGICMGLA
eukprot:CAMPEP_0119533320 /NCGR_PEP_ID=MMETSP1344-20130328/46720_1 /TAXON_ID=236787 /ORGANISM="Florenciella parvula, Strain CCMP2471" /LENGTH=264 /DNA_ID=CAMNT_0007574151 /DNA_START=319 /DNA_END=1109 /DNA_ORIENTATION=+